MGQLKVTETCGKLLLLHSPGQGHTQPCVRAWAFCQQITFLGVARHTHRLAGVLGVDLGPLGLRLDLDNTSTSHDGDAAERMEGAGVRLQGVCGVERMGCAVDCVQMCAETVWGV